MSISELDISFVILTWNSENHIEQSLCSIKSALSSSNLDYEIYIIDNGSEDNTLDFVQELKKSYSNKLIVIKLGRNTGTTYSRNLAIKKARGRFVCIMDSDVEIFPGTIEALVCNLQQSPAIGLAVPKLLYPSGSLQKSTDKFPTFLRKVQRYFFLKQIESKENNQTLPEKQYFTVDYAISALWLMKRQLFNEVGLLDEKIFYAPEDVDFCLRVWKAGYQVVYNPKVSAIHHTQEISRGFSLNKAFFSHISGLFYYFRKHGYLFSPPSF